MEQRTITYDDAIVRRFIAASVDLRHRRDAGGRAHRHPARSGGSANLGIPYLTFSRLRPLHTNAVIFAFVGNMMFAGIYYSTQRLCKARHGVSDFLSTIHFWGWQAIIVAAAITLPLGFTTRQGIRRARVADRHRHRRHLGGLRGQLLLDAREAAREAPLRRDLVLHRDDRHRGDAAHRQPPRDPGRA